MVSDRTGGRCRRMSKTAAVLTVVMTVLSVFVVVSFPEGTDASPLPDIGMSGDSTWTLDVDGTLTITGNEISGGDGLNSPWSIHRSSVRNVVIGKDIAYITAQVFDLCPNLTSFTVEEGNTAFSSHDGVLYNSDRTSLIKVPCGTKGEFVIPNSVTEIDSSAFSTCTSLNSIIIGDSVTAIQGAAFSGCTGLSSVTIPDSVQRIYGGVFRDCTGLTSVTIGSGAEIMNSTDMFAGCSSLVSIHVDINNAYLSSDDGGALYNKDKGRLIRYPLAKEGAYTAPVQLNLVDLDAFEDCSKLTSVTITSNLSDLPRFTGCTSLEAVVFTDNTTFTSSDGVVFTADGKTLCLFPQGKGGHYDIPDTVEEVSERAFNDTVSLTSVTIPDSVINLGYHTFMGSGVESVTVGAGVETIYDNTFSGCMSLREVIFRGDVMSISNGAFSDCSSLKTLNLPSTVIDVYSSAFRGCSSLESITLPNLLYIGSNTFEGCTSLKEVNLPVGLTVINPYAFKGCSSLESISIPDTVTDIGYAAFEGCSGLRSIDISGVSNVDMFVFRNCTSLESVTLHDGLESIGSGLFSGCTSLRTITLPSSLRNIGERAFECTGLTEFRIPSAVEMIYQGAFNSCQSLTEITVEDGNLYFASVDGVLYDSEIKSLLQYPAGKAGARYEVPAGVTSLSDSSFRGAGILTEIVLPDTVEFIGNYAFEDCTSLKYFDMGSIGLTGQSLFNGCRSLERFDADDSNPFFASVDGVLFTKDEKVLLYYPAARNASSYTIGPGVLLVSPYAFSQSTNLTEILTENNIRYVSIGGCLYEKDSTLVVCPAGLETYSSPADVVTVSGQAFSGDRLKSVHLGDVTLRPGAFWNCTSLNTIAVTSGTTFQESAIYFSDTEEHRIYLDAPDGYVFPDNGKTSNVILTNSPIGDSGSDPGGVPGNDDDGGGQNDPSGEGGTNLKDDMFILWIVMATILEFAAFVIIFSVIARRR